MSNDSELATLEGRLDAALLDDGDSLTDAEVDRLFELRRDKADAARPAGDQKPVRGASRIAQALLKNG